jgi:hypothetical protein
MAPCRVGDGRRGCRRGYDGIGLVEQADLERVDDPAQAAAKHRRHRAVET